VLHGGGNTSVKVRERNAIGEEVDILYVKGSSHDGIQEANRRAAGEPRQPGRGVPRARRSLFGDRAAFARWLVRDLPEKARPVGGDRGQPALHRRVNVAAFRRLAEQAAEIRGS
jgi:hypothetical protein